MSSWNSTRSIPTNCRAFDVSSIYWNVRVDKSNVNVDALFWKNSLQGYARQRSPAQSSIRLGISSDGDACYRKIRDQSTLVNGAKGGTILAGMITCQGEPSTGLHEGQVKEGDWESKILCGDHMRPSSASIRSMKDFKSSRCASPSSSRSRRKSSFKSGRDGILSIFSR